MKAFLNAALAEDQSAQNEVTSLYGLRETISHALGLYEDKFRFFEQNGLSHDVLTDYDRYLEANLQKEKPLTLDDLNRLIPFVFRMGKAYNQLMADSFVTNPNNGGTTAIEYAGALYPVLNFFYEQKAKLYPAVANEPRFENA